VIDVVQHDGMPIGRDPAGEPFAEGDANTSFDLFFDALRRSSYKVLTGVVEEKDRGGVCVKRVANADEQFVQQLVEREVRERNVCDRLQAPQALRWIQSPAAHPAHAGSIFEVLHDTMDFPDYVKSQLLAPPGRVLEVGCGEEGGVAPALADAGYDVLAIDPDAPEGPLYRRVTLEELDENGPFDAVVAGRVLHHVHPLGRALDKLVRLAPVLILDEFAWNHMDEATADWYEAQHRVLVAAGHEPKGPRDLAEWRARHRDLHPYETLRAEVDARYEERDFEWLPYFYRWLEGPATEPLEATLIDVGAIRPIGFRYAGVRRDTVRSSAESR
jgi:hypothetical protein